MTSDEIKTRMLAYAAGMRQRHHRIHETFPYRGQGLTKLRAWKEACADFHASQSKLDWPVPYGQVEWLDAIVSGEIVAVEMALCFLECRPYFFRSGYMFKDILRMCKRAPLSPEHAERFKVILEKWETYQKTRKRSG